MADAELKTFLGLVEEGRGEAFIDSIIAILKANDVERPCHLRKLVEGNVNYGDAAVTAGKRGFVAAAIEAAVAEFSPGASSVATVLADTSVCLVLGCLRLGFSCLVHFRTLTASTRGSA